MTIKNFLSFRELPFVPYICALMLASAISHLKTTLVAHNSWLKFYLSFFVAWKPLCVKLNGREKVFVLQSRERGDKDCDPMRLQRIFVKNFFIRFYNKQKHLKRLFTTTEEKQKKTQSWKQNCEIDKKLLVGTWIRLTQKSPQ